MSNMILSLSFDELEIHRLNWASCAPFLSVETVPQAMLLLGPKHLKTICFAYRWVARIFCENKRAPCGQCRSCMALKNGFHPDLSVLTKEQDASSIKIDQIRALQDMIYQTPSWQQIRFVLLYPLETLNVAASNAILKLLEEPPKHVKFILISESYQVLPTLMSRCQRLYFNDGESFRKLNDDYLNITQYYPETDLRHQFKDKQNEFCLMLERLFKNQCNICDAALLWKDIELHDFLWFLYLFISNCIAKIKFGLKKNCHEFQVIQYLCDKFNQPAHLYKVLDRVLDFTRVSKQNVALNHALVVETLLLDFIEAPHA